MLVLSRRAPRSRHAHDLARWRRRKRLERFGRALVVALMAAAACIAGVLWERVAAAEPVPADREAARFARCGAAARITCVVDGDTFLYRGAKIRLADINTPELSRPACPREAALAEAATLLLEHLLNQGSFTLARSPGRDRDRYGRLLRTATRDGESLGAVLVREGLAEPWQGRRSGWCGGEVHTAS